MCVIRAWWCGSLFLYVSMYVQQIHVADSVKKKKGGDAYIVGAEIFHLALGPITNPCLLSIALPSPLSLFLSVVDSHLQQ